MEVAEENALNLQCIFLLGEKKNHHEILFSHLSKMAIHCTQECSPVSTKSSRNSVQTVLVQFHGNLLEVP